MKKKQKIKLLQSRPQSGPRTRCSSGAPSRRRGKTC